MGRILLIILILAAVVLVWKAFGPSSWKKGGRGSDRGEFGSGGFTAGSGRTGQARDIPRGPDDDEDFMWKLEKQRIQQRKQEREQRRNSGGSGDAGA